MMMFENKVLRRIITPIKDEVAEEWRKLYDGECHNLYSSPNTVRMVKSS